MSDEKMMAVRKEIERVISSVFPAQYLCYVFDDRITIQDVSLQIMMECCKYAHDTVSPKHSLRHHLQKAEMKGDDDRMIIQNTLKKINTHRSAEYQIRKQQTGIEIDGLLPKKMDDIEAKLSGYELNEFQFWEIQNVHDMKLVDAILKNKFKAKNFKGEYFQDYAKEYDSTIGSIISKAESEDDQTMVFSSLALFTLEWKYNFDFYYKIAEEMETQRINSIPELPRRCSLFCGPVALSSVLSVFSPGIVNDIIHTDSRMLLIREKFVHEFACIPAGEQFESMAQQYVEAMVIVASIQIQMTYCGMNIREWFVKNTTMEDWAAVMKEYDVAQCFVPHKQWSKKRIGFVKKFYTATYTDFKNPGFRS